MKRDLLEFLACPICKGELTLHIKKEENGEIVEGSLNCAACKVDYPIEDAIPNMLPPALRS